MATLKQIKELRDMSGAGINAVKEALETSGGDTQKAMEYLREKGVAKAEKRAGKVASNGVFGTYVHNNNRVVSVVEVVCETDFAAKSEDFIKFANDVALHIAAMNPEMIKVDDIPEEEIAKQKESYTKELEGKPEEIKEKIIEGKLQKFYLEKNVLMKQPLFSDDSKTVEDYLNELIAKLGEKMYIRSFRKFEIASTGVACQS